MSKKKKTKVIKVTSDAAFFTEDPRKHMPATAWAKFVEWQSQLVDKLEDNGTWIIPAAHGYLTFDKKDKSYSITLEDYEEDAPSAIYVQNARMNIIPKTIDVLADVGYRVSKMNNIDGYLIEPIKAAVGRSAGKFGEAQMVKSPVMPKELSDDFQDPLGVTEAVQAVVMAIAKTYSQSDKARHKVQARMRDEMIRVFNAHNNDEKALIAAYHELAHRITTKEVY